MARLTALLFALLLSAQAALPGETMRVCRFTGQRVDPCACPETKRPEDARLLPQGCCEVRSSHHEDVPGVVPGLDSRPLLVALEWPVSVAWQPPEPSAEPGPRVRSGHDPPPRARLFLSLRQLLL